MEKWECNQCCIGKFWIGLSRINFSLANLTIKNNQMSNKIINQTSSNLTEEISIARLQSDNPNNQLEIYFSTTKKVGGEVISVSNFDSALQIDMTNPELRAIWLALEAKILEAKQAQLDNPEAVTLSPDFNGFLGSLLSGNNGQPADIFVLVQTAIAQAPPNLISIANLSYSNFSTQITLAINGNPNISALQECLNNLLSILPPETDLTELTTLFETYRIPLTA